MLFFFFPSFNIEVKIVPNNASAHMQYAEWFSLELYNGEHCTQYPPHTHTHSHTRTQFSIRCNNYLGERDTNFSNLNASFIGLNETKINQLS